MARNNLSDEAKEAVVLDLTIASAPAPFRMCGRAQRHTHISVASATGIIRGATRHGRNSRRPAVVIYLYTPRLVPIHAPRLHAVSAAQVLD